MRNFCKNKECPTSEEILAFVEGRRRRVTDGGIEYHVSVCEFCLAEVELYRLYPPIDEKVEAEKIPAPLMELAEALLKKKRDLTPLYRLIDRSA
ncbi:MAG TPA: hypothetical protein VFZ23_06460 [Pyrinomonadaceae bacterium]